MLIIPAIDIKDGKLVRLWQGDFERVSLYCESPLEMALAWQKKGAEFIHIVDLDGARLGLPSNLELIREIAAVLTIPVQAGGGLRRRKDIEDLLSGKVERVVLATRAIEERAWLRELLGILMIRS